MPDIATRIFLLSSNEKYTAPPLADLDDYIFAQDEDCADVMISER